MSKISGVKLRIKDNKISYEFYPVDFKLADKNRILQPCVHCIVLKPSGKILIVRRSKKRHVHPDCNSFPAGHIDFGETPKKAALRELYEETKLRPISIKQIFRNNMFIDNFGHFAFVFVCVVRNNDKPVFDPSEINSKKSKFEKIEDVIKKLNTEQFTPLSRMILISFLRKFPTTKKVKEFISRITKK